MDAGHSISLEPRGTVVLVRERRAIPFSQN